MVQSTILIADDDSDLVMALRKRCEAVGLRTRTASNAFDALNLIYKTDPDLICLDVNMPRGNGLSIVEMLSNDESLCATPVIIMTGDASEETIRRCYNLCAYYVEKGSDVWPRIEPLIQELVIPRETP